MPESPDNSPEGLRFAFGRNWHRFVRRNFNEERLQAARSRLLSFAGIASLRGHRFLDIGCGSGLHSYAALTCEAERVHSLDYDHDSVAATRALHERAGRPSHWTFERGDVLDADYLEGLGQWSFVYSWGVLHHTGDMWRAIRNAQARVAPGGLLVMALYSADADFHPSKEFWLDVKRRYNAAGPVAREAMVWWYVWRFGLSRSLLALPRLARQIWTYRVNRGMSYFADIRDWLGGWPMEYAADQQVVDLLEGECGFTLRNITTGEACTEFLFVRDGGPRKRAVVRPSRES